jgi:branched-chain amino acid transport system permease protein
VFKSKKFIISWILILVGLLALITLPFYLPGYPVILMSSILMYVILTVSWVLFSGPTGYVSLAPAAFFGVGIYASAIFGKVLPFPMVVFIGGLASSVLAIIVGALTLRLKGIYFAIFTFGLVMLISQVMLFWELQVTGTRGRFVVVKGYETVYYYMLGLFVILLVTSYLLKRSKYGLALLGIGQEEDATAHGGVNVVMVKVSTFALSAFFMGTVGSVMATKWTYIDPGIAFNPFYSFMPVLMAIFGGTGQLLGPVIGASIFTYLEEFLITRFPEVYMLIFGFILVIAITYMPSGITGLIQKLYKRYTGSRHVDSGS